MLVLAALLLALQVQGATAGLGWCRSDPVVTIDGRLADIFVSAPLDAPLKVTGPTKIVVTVPVGVEARLVLADLGFGKGEEVSFAQSRALKKTATGIEVQVAVYVPATDGTMPVKVEFAPGLLGLLRPASAQGTANAWVVLNTTR
jgi:hypothetical protein